MQLVFLKSNVKGYTRKDGVVVAAHTNKVLAKPAKAQFDHKAPLPDEAYAGKDKPVGKPSQQMQAALFPSEKQGSLFGGESFGPKPKKPGLMANFGSNGAKSTGSKSPKLVGAQYGGHTPGKYGSGAWGASKPEPKHYPNAAVHPQPHEDGKPFVINEPSTATDPHTWEDPEFSAVFVPGGPVPAELHGVPFAPWTDHPTTEVGWNYVEGQMPDLEEPELAEAGKKDFAAGVIVEEPDGRVWLMHPSNQFGGYKATYPKGRADHGMSLQASAIKECFEETGLKVEITGFVGDIERTQTVARYYRARRVGGTPANMGWEAQAVQLVPADRLHSAVNMAVDQKIATMAGFEAKAKSA